MPITLLIEKSLYFQDAIKMASKSGRQEGKQEGKQEGLEEKSFTVVKNLLLKTKLTMEEIAETAEVKCTYVQAVKKSLKLA